MCNSHTYSWYKQLYVYNILCEIPSEIPLIGKRLFTIGLFSLTSTGDYYYLCFFSVDNNSNKNMYVYTTIGGIDVFLNIRNVLNLKKKILKINRVIRFVSKIILLFLFVRFII